MDVAMPVSNARAGACGLTGRETVAERDGNRAVMDRMARVRREAGRRMRVGDVSASVTPKFARLAPARPGRAGQGGAVAARHFMPWNCHPRWPSRARSALPSAC